MKATLTFDIDIDPEVGAASFVTALNALLASSRSQLTLEDVGEISVGRVELLDAEIENFYPDVDAINVTVGDLAVNISRDEHGDTHVAVIAPETRTDLVLGQEGETQKA
jgi:hypothetical protein